MGKKNSKSEHIHQIHVYKLVYIRNYIGKLLPYFGKKL